MTKSIYSLISIKCELSSFSFQLKKIKNWLGRAISTLSECSKKLLNLASKVKNIFKNKDALPPHPSEKLTPIAPPNTSQNQESQNKQDPSENNTAKTKKESRTSIDGNQESEFITDNGESSTSSITDFGVDEEHVTEQYDPLIEAVTQHPNCVTPLTSVENSHQDHPDYHIEGIIDFKNYRGTVVSDEMLMKIRGDGNCLFYALEEAFKLRHPEKIISHRELRNIATDYLDTHYFKAEAFLLKNWLISSMGEENEVIQKRLQDTLELLNLGPTQKEIAQIENMLVEDALEFKDTPEQIIANSRREGVFGSLPHIYALSKSYNIPIYIYDGQYGWEQKIETDNSVEAPIRLYLNNKHFDLRIAKNELDLLMAKDK